MIRKQNYLHLYYNNRHKDNIFSKILKENNREVLTLYLFEFSLFKYFLFPSNGYINTFLQFEERFAEKYLRKGEDDRIYWDYSEDDFCGITWEETNSIPVTEVILHFKISDKLLFRMAEVFQEPLQDLLMVIEAQNGEVFYE